MKKIKKVSETKDIKSIKTMKKSSKKYFAPALALGILIPTGVYLASEARADNNGSYPPIIQKLATKFGVNEEEIKTVFDEHREERKEERVARLEERLDEAVKNGKITEVQKEAILKKKAELQVQHQENREAWRNLSEEEKKELHEIKKEHRAEFEKWAEENGIDLEALKGYLFEGKGPGHGKGFHRGGMRK